MDEIQEGTNLQKGKNRKKRKKPSLPVTFVGIQLFVFIVGLILTLASRSGVGNLILLVSGVIDLIVAVVLYKIVDYRTKYTCSECGAKRVHHREFIRTEERDETINGRFRRKYTHVYRDTFVCPQCGETLTMIVRKYGGMYSETENGGILDQRIPPRTF